MNIISKIDIIKANLEVLKTTKSDVERGRLTALSKKTLDELRKLDTKGLKISKDLKASSIQVLDEAKVFFQKSTQKDVIHDITLEIEKVQRKIKTTPLSDHKISYPKIGLSVACFFDIDNDDNNTGILIGTLNAIKSRVPFITSASILHGTKVEENKENAEKLSAEALKLLKEAQPPWEIYSKGGFLICLPGNLLQEKKGQEKLKALDLQESLKPISLDKTKELASIEKTMDDFIAIFADSATIDKLFLVNGHGSARTISAMNEMNYKKFLSFLEKQRCKALMIDSCYSGGVSTLNTLSLKEDISFTIMTRSLGEFTTYAGDVGEKNIKKLFDELALFMTGTSSKTVANLREVLQKVETVETTEHKLKEGTNLVQAYFPAAPGVPVGFRPVGEGKRGFALTMNLLRTHELRPKDLQIEVHDQEFLQLNPLVIKPHIAFKGRDPILVSMIPGDSHHFLKSIELGEEDFVSFIRQTMDFYQKHDFQGAAKSFFIEHLTSTTEEVFSLAEFFRSKSFKRNRSFEGIVLSLEKNQFQCAYREGKKYYQFTSQVYIPQEMSAKEYSNFCMKTMSNTTAQKIAERAATGAQEDEETFQAALKESMAAPPRSLTEACWRGDLNAVMQFLQKIPGAEECDLAFRIACQNNQHKVLNLLLNYGPFATPSGRNHCLELAVEVGKPDAVKFLLKDKRLDPSMQNNSLLLSAVKKGDSEIVQHLLADKRVDPSVNFNQPLSLACEANDPLIVSILLRTPSFRPEIGIETALHRAFKKNNLDALRVLLLSSKIPINIKKRTIAAACKNGMSEIVHRLVRELPTIVDIALDSIVASGNMTLAQHLIDDPDLNFSIKDKLVELAHVAKNEKLIQLLLTRLGANLETTLESTARFGNFAILKDFIKDPRVGRFKKRMFLTAVNAGRTDVLQLLFDSGYVMSQAVGEKALYIASLKGNSDIVKLLLSKKVDPSVKENIALRIACKHNHKEVVALLLQDPLVDPMAKEGEAYRLTLEKNFKEITQLLEQDRRFRLI